jgi:hypothetical protein
VKVAGGLHPAIVSTDAGPVIAWNAPDGLQVAAPERETILLDPAGKFVALAATDAATIAAWERGEQTLTRVLPQPGHATQRSPAPRAAVPQYCSPAVLQCREALLPAAAMVWRVLIVLFQQVHAEVASKVAPD